mgnify:FL=1
MIEKRLFWGIAVATAIIAIAGAVAYFVTKFCRDRREDDFDDFFDCDCCDDDCCYCDHDDIEQAEETAEEVAEEAEEEAEQE